MNDKDSYFTTYEKKYNCCFQEKELISDIFLQILNQALCGDLIDLSELFVNGVHIKVVANSHKYRKEIVEQQAKFMSDQLKVEIDLD